ncbi:M23 family metallopeptidase, partial [Gracilimonas sp.]|uniref:M23 family metallopeptidase n=1 Tax=Gracilimonas sp. TaxID=1974203 RepID=UPI0028718043|nr:M23 family metallopeptidase [Gracilimonas sp.]
YHNAIKAQQYAIDIVKVNERGRFYTNDGSELEDVFSFGEPVYSPVDGIVVALVDTIPNSEITLAPSDSLNPAGNHVVIEFETDRFVFLAHLEPYSISINEGDTISVGDFIGTIG